MKAVALIAALVVLVVVVGAACAAEQASPAPEQVTVAQAPAKAAPAAAGAPTPERVDALEKQNLVLSEDLGKAQLKARQLEEATKQQAAAIQKLNDQVAQQQAQAEAERKKQAQRNQYFWIAIGLVVLAVAAN